MGAYATTHRIAWRGLKNANFALTSTLQRSLEAEKGGPVTEERMREREKRILLDARGWGLDILGGRRVDDLQLLTDLQHYGVPTRLLDFTSNPMTALWFACEKEPKPNPKSNSRGGGVAWSASGLVLAMNIAPWYRKGRRESGVPKPTVYETVVQDPWAKETAGRAMVQMETHESRLEAALDLSSPFLVSSSTPNPRLRAQEGFFIASGLPDPHDGAVGAIKWKGSGPTKGTRQKRAIIEVGTPATRGYPSSVPFMAFYVDADWKTDLRKLLRQNYRQKASVLFPDFTGFAMHKPWLS
ncbi:FRG domain-containing protein [Isoptericola sp. QY 916]|uniref:FRG domain-containing protein n=1 Tax=Isoptericola sp. QY 916 TaxID=2782570 RepID=UPI003D2FEC5F|nr:FRG domain-containing protein [Isoptericola sp. QY 916]